MIFPTISLRIERWKFNKDYGVYVSTLGNFKDRYKRPLPIKINQSGYCMIKTEVPHNPWKLAHRIVMLTWKPVPDSENLTVDHLNHNKRDNSLVNLEWVTAKENIRRARKDYLPIGNTVKPTTIEEFKDKILGYSVNDIFCANEEEVYIALLKFYPGGYPKAKIHDKIKTARSQKNPKFMAKFGKQAVFKLVMKEEN